MCSSDLVEHALVERERKPVGQHEIVDEQRERAEIRGEPVDAGKGQVPLLLRTCGTYLSSAREAAVSVGYALPSRVVSPAANAFRKLGRSGVTPVN